MLERVLVQGLLNGLAPDVSKAIKSIPRWRFVQFAFPHVMHCTATLLHNRYCAVRERAARRYPAPERLWMEPGKRGSVGT